MDTLFDQNKNKEPQASDNQNSNTTHPPFVFVTPTHHPCVVMTVEDRRKHK
jgi:hypothetical protein